MKLANKFKVRDDIKSRIEQEDKSDKDDNRVLPYYNLKKNEKMKVLILPDTDGNIWKKYKVHGKNLGVRSAGRVRCIHEANGEECPVCQKAFQDVGDAKDIDNEKLAKEAKDRGKRWFASDYTLASVLVLESPFEVPESDDGNQIKLWYVPYAVEQKIKQMIAEQQISSEEITVTPFVIKKTENQGGRASYEHSYFDREQIDLEAVLEEYEEDEIVQFDFNAMSEDENENIIPSAPSLDEIEEWLEKAIEKVDEADAKSAKSGRTSAGGDDKKNQARERIKSRRSGKTEDDQDNTGSDEQGYDEEQHEEQESSQAGESSGDDDEGKEERPRTSRLKRRRSLRTRG